MPVTTFRTELDSTQLFYTPTIVSHLMNSLTQKKCVPCQGGIPPLKGKELLYLQKELGHEWMVIQEHHLERAYTFPDFKKALDFTVKVGKLAEKEGHHPDIHLSWGKVKITTWTHKINGLTESDFILATKIDDLFS